MIGSCDHNSINILIIKHFLICIVSFNRKL